MKDHSLSLTACHHAAPAFQPLGTACFRQELNRLSGIYPLDADQKGNHSQQKKSSLTV
jgi:hypothetical protein